jgi:ABC-type Fe3+ transport system permease subunit
MDTILAAVMGLLMPGILVALGFIVIFVKLKRKTALWWLGHPIWVDVLAFILAFLTHGGDTFAGGMAATVAGILTSCMTSFGRYTFGYIEKKVYHPGALVQYDPETLV